MQEFIDPCFDERPGLGVEGAGVADAGEEDEAPGASEGGVYALGVGGRSIRVGCAVEKEDGDADAGGVAEWRDFGDAKGGALFGDEECLVDGGWGKDEGSAFGGDGAEV